MESMVERFVRYTSINTRSNEESTTIPSTQTQVDFATNVLVPDLKAIGLDEVIYNRENGFVIGTLNANTDAKAPSIGFIAHMDTADYNAENIKPRIIENYDGKATIALDQEGKFTLNTADFPNHTVNRHLSGFSLCAGGEKDKFLIWVIEFLYKLICNKTEFLIQCSWCNSFYIISPKCRNRYFFCPV